jgi:nucleoside-diphosphate-sugar epimerase
VQTIYHCVAQVPMVKNKALIWSVNRDGTRNLLQAAKEAGVRKVVHISSSAVFGGSQAHPITRETPPVAAEDYGAAKIEAEQICRQFADQGLDVTIIRPRTIMGHGRLGLMQLIFEWVFQGRNVFVLGKGDNEYAFVHADDLADACLRAARRPGFAIYNVGAAKWCTMRQTLEGLVAYAGTGSKVRSLPFGPAVFAMKLTSRLGLSPLFAYIWLAYGKNGVFDITPVQQELGWQPRWGNVEMFIQSYDWYVAHRDRVRAGHGKSPHRSAVKEGILKLLRWV